MHGTAPSLLSKELFSPDGEGIDLTDILQGDSDVPGFVGCTLLCCCCLLLLFPQTSNSLVVLCDPGRPIFPLWTPVPFSVQFVTVNSRSLWICKMWYLIWGLSLLGPSKQTGIGWGSPSCGGWRYDKPPLNQIKVTMVGMVTYIFIGPFTKNISKNAPGSPAP